MTNEEAIRILKNAAFLATSTSYQAIEEAVEVAVKALTSATDINVATKDGDMVYRQDVIDALDEIESEVADGDGFQYEKWRRHFTELPSVQPDHNADIGKKVEAEDCISRQEAIDALRMDISIIPFAKAREYAKAIIETIYNRLEDLPPAPERKTGKWKMLPNGNALCSECGYMQVHAWDLEGWDNYCHHCGADMREGHDAVN